MKIRTSKGFTLVELMVGILIFVVMVAGVYSMLNSGRAAWLTTDVQVRLQQSLRQTLQKILKELRESGSDALGAMQVTIFDNAGVNNSDIIRFSIPVICETFGSVINTDGDVANWGAPLTWGCNSTCDINDEINGCALTCMDADDDCVTVDYRFIEYQIDADNQLLRRVLDNNAGLVRQDIFAQDITNFQVSLSGDQNIVTLTVTALRNTYVNRQVTATTNVDVYLRNRG